MSRYPKPSKAQLRQMTSLDEAIAAVGPDPFGDSLSVVQSPPGRPMTQQRAADRLAAALVKWGGGLHQSGIVTIDGPVAARAILTADPALADAIELGLLLLSDDGPKALAALFASRGILFAVDREKVAREFIAALTAKLRERA